MNTHPTIDELLDALKTYKLAGKRPAERIAGVTDNSRDVVPGGMFVAVCGTAVDGHRFVDAALKNGASAIVVQHMPADASEDVLWVQVPDSREALGRLASRFYGDPSEELTLIGVTGTNGKTTIATLLYELMRSLGRKAGLISTVANYIDGVVYPADHTTPHPLKLNELLRRMVDAGCTFAVMEVSSHAADQHRIAGLDFDGAIFTNLTRDHLDYHKTVDTYLKAKKSFFDGLPETAFALVNADDRNGAVMLQNCKAGRQLRYSTCTVADFRVNVIEDRLDGMLLEFDGTAMDTPFAGRFNASNLAAVYGAAVALGYEPHRVLTAMSALRPVAGRFQPFRSNDGVTVIVDFAHTPDALVNVLDTIGEAMITDSEVWCVIGAGGDRDKGKRPLMARAAFDRCNHLVLTSDNPRSEDPESIISDMLAGLTPEERSEVRVTPDRRSAIAEAVAAAAPGDAVLVAGKGHETEQIIGSEVHHFDDREEVRAAIRHRNETGA